MKVVECVNRNCNNTFYVTNNTPSLHLQCEKCTNKE